MKIESLTRGRIQLGSRLHALAPNEIYDDKQDRTAADEFALLSSAFKHRDKNLIRILEGPEFLKYDSNETVAATTFIKKPKSKFKILSGKKEVEIDSQDIDDIVRQINDANFDFKACVVNDKEIIGFVFKFKGHEGNVVTFSLYDSETEIETPYQLSDGAYGTLTKHNIIKHVVEENEDELFLDAGVFPNTVEFTTTRVDNDGFYYNLNKFEHKYLPVDNHYLYVKLDPEVKKNDILTLKINS